LDEEKLIEVGDFYQYLNDIIGANLPLIKIYRSKGLPAHLIENISIDDIHQLMYHSYKKCVKCLCRIIEVGNGSRHTRKST